MNVCPPPLEIERRIKTLTLAGMSDWASFPLDAVNNLAQREEMFGLNL